MQELKQNLLLVKEHIHKSLKIGNSTFTHKSIITTQIIEEKTMKPILCSIDEFDIVTCLLTVNLREDGHTSLYNYSNYDERQFEGTKSYLYNVQEGMPTYHGKVTIGGHNEIHHSIRSLLDSILILNFPSNR